MANKIVKTDTIHIPNYTTVVALNKLHIGETLKASHKVHEVNLDKSGNIVSEKDIDVVEEGFQIRRVLGGFMYEYDAIALPLIPSCKVV